MSAETQEKILVYALERIDGGSALLTRTRAAGITFVFNRTSTVPSAYDAQNKTITVNPSMGFFTIIDDTMNVMRTAVQSHGMK